MDIVYFGNDWSGENRTSSHHIARRLSERFRLLYVEVPGLRAPKADARDIRKIGRKLRTAVQRPRRIAERMWRMTVPQIPFRGLPVVSAANQCIGALLVRAAMQSAGMRRPLLWFTVPHAAPFLGRLDEEFSVYYCIDDYSALPGVDAIQVAKMDADLTVRADLVFASSQTLFASKQLLNAGTILSPHGVDAELFARAQSAEPPVDRVRSLPRPVIGMHGVVDDRIDVELVAAIARARPNWTLLLIGRVATDIAPLRELRNIVLPGVVPYDELPDWARGYDVSIMPYRHGKFSENANPLKLREYLACGKPVVSIPMPSVEPFRQHVLTAGSAAEFVGCIEQALATDSAQAAGARMAAVEHMSWDARVAEVIATVEQHRAAKAGRLATVQAA